MGRERRGFPFPYIGAPLSNANGGAVNSRPTSNSLSVSQCRNITEAARFAVKVGVPLNRFITINWTSAGVADGFGATARYLKRAGDWLSDRGIPRVYCWVREGIGGDHVHILLHVPMALSRTFSRVQKRWLRALGAHNVRGVLHTRPVARSYDAPWTSPSQYRLNLDCVVRYILKGATEDGSRFTDHRRRPSGAVDGRRCAVSNYIGQRARIDWAACRSDHATRSPCSILSTHD